MKNDNDEGGAAPLRIFIAEDHEIVREGLKALVNSQPDMIVVGEAGDGEAAIALAQEMRPDLVIMDVTMPKVNGLEATEKLKQVCPEVKVLTLTRHADTGFMQQLFRAGASGYVLKQSATSELVRAIRTIVAGNSYLDPAITQKVLSGYVTKQDNSLISKQSELSDREEDVLKKVAWGYSNKEIAAQLDISVKTVEAHKSNAMRKLELGSRIDVVRFALLQGWLKEN
ncbi:MAG TPA: response regulator transcription factor [Blastocatellia bacterium]|nr:response regulator transcription factor [Blastocatellia bacterium]